MSEYEVGSSPWEMNLGSTSPVNLKFSSYLGRLLLSRSVMSNFLQPHGLQPAGLLCPWDFPGKNTGVGCFALLQGIFPTQGPNPHLLCRRADSLPLEECVSYKYPNNAAASC